MPAPRRFIPAGRSSARPAGARSARLPRHSWLGPAISGTPGLSPTAVLEASAKELLPSPKTRLAAQDLGARPSTLMSTVGTSPVCRWRAFPRKRPRSSLGSFLAVTRPAKRQELAGSARTDRGVLGYCTCTRRSRACADHGAPLYRVGPAGRNGLAAVTDACSGLTVRVAACTAPITRKVPDSASWAQLTMGAPT